tara:strand:+ start:474 stop:677 length:204 start_codon:yes stop_codon:yes gene_type:complete
MPTFNMLDFVVVLWIVSEGNSGLVVTANCHGIALMQVESLEEAFEVNTLLGCLRGCHYLSLARGKSN